MSCSQHPRLIGLPLNPMECGNFRRRIAYASTLDRMDIETMSNTFAI
jgi:hypothetical protein